MPPHSLTAIVVADRTTQHRRWRRPMCCIFRARDTREPSTRNLSELLREREGIDIGTHHAAAYLAERRSEQSAPAKATAASGTAPTDAR